MHHSVPFNGCLRPLGTTHLHTDTYPWHRLSPCCLPAATGQPVEGCDSRNRFCRPIPGNDRFVCQYSFRPEGSLCRLRANATTAAFDETSLEELSAAEIDELGLEAEPSAEALNEPEDESPSVQIAGASETQQTRRTRRTKPNRGNRANSKALTCGQCRNNVCAAASAKWCKEARKRSANGATAETTASSI